MKRSVYALLCLLVVTLVSRLVAEPSQSIQWRKLENTIAIQSPETALKVLEPILKESREQKRYSDLAMAVIWKALLEGKRQGDSPVTKIKLLEAAIDECPVEVRPVLAAIRAHWIWFYCWHERGFAHRRASYSDAPDADTSLWSDSRLMDAIDKIFQSTLADSKILKTIASSDYESVFPKGNMPDACQPTLYDFIVLDAIHFYCSKTIATRYDPILDASETGLFANADKFVNWRHAGATSPAPMARVVCLYQDLLRFHQKDKDPTAFIAADLDRLLFAKNFAFGGDKHTLYRKSLVSLSGKWRRHSMHAILDYHLALQLHESGESVEALRIATQGQLDGAVPIGAEACARLVGRIKNMEAAVFARRVWNKPYPDLTVKYRNIDRLHFRIVPADYPWDRVSAPGNSESHVRYESRLAAILQTKPALEWMSELTPTTDFKSKTHKIQINGSLTNGFYWVLASHDPGFRDKQNYLGLSGIWVSDITFAARERLGALEGIVFNAKTGDPVADAVVSVWTDRHGPSQNQMSGQPIFATKEQEQKFRAEHANKAPLKMTTSQDGFFSMTPKEHDPIRRIGVFHEDSVVSNPDYYQVLERIHPWNRNPELDKKQTRCRLFTDRSVYRPSQIVQYKGICFEQIGRQVELKALQSPNVTVALFDANHQEIERRSHACNDFGSFSGGFSIPSGKLTGNYQIRVVGGHVDDGVAFSVEEYKRSRVMVTIDTPAPVALGRKISVGGRVTSYSGDPIRDARVQLKLEARESYSCLGGGWRIPEYKSNMDAIAGETTTDSQGCFNWEIGGGLNSITDANPNRIRTYTVAVEATDPSGATCQTEKTFDVGTTATQLVLHTEGLLGDEAPVTLKIQTQSFSGAAQTCKGSCEISSLTGPNRIAPETDEEMGMTFQDYFRWHGQESMWREGEATGNAIDHWPVGKAILKTSFETGADGFTTISAKLAAGAYEIKATTTDSFGAPVVQTTRVKVIHTPSDNLGLRLPFYCELEKDTVNPGENFVAVWGTGYDAGRAFVEIERKGKLVKQYWTKKGRTQEKIEFPVTSDLCGGFIFRITQGRENRVYSKRQFVKVPWSDKALTLKWEHFTSKLEPGQKETWTAVVTNPDGKPVNAEMAAALYDASLDAVRTHNWEPPFYLTSKSDPRWGYIISDQGIYDHDGNRNFAPNNVMSALTGESHDWNPPSDAPRFIPRSYKKSLIVEVLSLAARKSRFYNDRSTSFDGYFGGRESYGEMAMMSASAPQPVSIAEINDYRRAPGDIIAAPRRNLGETAFFYPHVQSDKQGILRMTFTMPESLTQWRFLGFAHDKKFRSGLLEASATTARDFMVQPNAPRFLRECDELEFTGKLINRSSTAQSGKIRLSFSSALNEANADAWVKNDSPERSFDVPAMESKVFSWRIQVPLGCDPLTYCMTASNMKLSDGEEGLLPVLPQRIILTESIAMSVNGPGQQEYRLSKLAESNQTGSTNHISLTVQMVSNPLWHVVLSMPYLMESPNECTERIFNRYYANSVAAHILKSNPDIGRVFAQWRQLPQAGAPLTRNATLHKNTLQETPWVVAAATEDKARRDMAALFDENRMRSEISQSRQTLSQMQWTTGWPWFKGGVACDDVTTYIIAGFGRLRRLGAAADNLFPLHTLTNLDQRFVDAYRHHIQAAPFEGEKLVSPAMAFRLYARSFFLKDTPIRPECRQACDFILDKARTSWQDLDSRMSRAHLALALARFGDKATAALIVSSLKELSQCDASAGRYWPEDASSWRWHRAPVESQVMMIEALDEVLGDVKAVEECKTWLLTQKRTQHWASTKATADAVYALLSTAGKTSMDRQLTDVWLGGGSAKGGVPVFKDAVDFPVEAGSGYYQKTFGPREITTNMAGILVRKTQPGQSWGSVLWRYWQDADKVKSSASQNMTIKKCLYRQQVQNGKTIRKSSTAPLVVGDTLVVQLELEVNQDMEYVHIKDPRSCGFEPVDAMSGWTGLGGMSYYRTSNDTAANFFIERLPKGKHVIEYILKAAYRGRYQSGAAEIQCMYAPEFSARSGNDVVVIE